MNTNWTTGMPCTTVDVDVFFPIGYSSQYQKAIDRAASYCRRCPQIERCLEEALTMPSFRDKDGIYGGTTPPERRAIREAREQAEDTQLTITEKRILNLIERGIRRSEIAAQVGLKSLEIAAIYERLTRLGHNTARRYKPTTTTDKCGTSAGKRIHNKRGERACTDCLNAERDRAAAKAARDAQQTEVAA